MLKPLQEQALPVSNSGGLGNLARTLQASMTCKLSKGPGIMQIRRPVSLTTRCPLRTPSHPLFCIRPAPNYVVHAKGKSFIQGAVDTGSKLVDQVTEFVPDSVPRPVARTGVAVGGGLIAFWLLQKVVTTALTFALIGGALFLYFKNNKDDDSDNSKGGGSDLDDPLAEAQRIMKKYK